MLNFTPVAQEKKKDKKNKLHDRKSHLSTPMNLKIVFWRMSRQTPRSIGTDLNPRPFPQLMQRPHRYMLIIKIRGMLQVM
jgi:hypothetical protein